MGQMTIWIVAFLLTIAAIVMVSRPFWRKSHNRERSAAYDREVYKDQLIELQRDEALGLISGAEAEEARLEISRRLLKADNDLAMEAEEKSSGASGSILLIVALVAVPALSWGLYLYLGNPGRTDLPLAARLDKDPRQNSLVELVARAETQLASNPDDIRGWRVLAPIYMRMGRFDSAVNAWRNVIRIEGETAASLNNLGEALGAAQNGRVEDESLEAFQKALKLEPENEKARFFIGVAQAQSGQMDQARETWTVLSRSTDENSPWRQASLRALGQADAEEKKASSTTPGPSQEDIDAAQQMTSSEQQEMIEGMVQRLDARLRDNPDDAEGWQRLIRAYVVMGRKEDASSALDRALQAFADNEEMKTQLVSFAESMGIKSVDKTQ